MNKKGVGEMILNVVIFAVFLVVAIGISWGVLLFYGEQIDLRETQAEVLADRIGKCFLEFSDIDSLESVYSECKLNEGVFDEDFYFKVGFFDFDGNQKREPISGGNRDFEIQCSLEGRHFAKCSEKSFIVFIEGNEVKLEVVAGSNFHGGRV